MGWQQPQPEQVQAALDWLRGQDPRLSLDALARSLRGAGYGAQEVAAAIEIRQAELDAALPAGSDLRRRAAAILIVAFFGTWAVMSVILIRPVDSYWHAGGAAALILGALLGGVLLLSLLGVLSSGRLRRGLEGALVAVLTIPFVFLVIIAGLCVVTTNGLTI